MKLLLLWLLPLLSYFPIAGPAPVSVTFSPLTKTAYLAAKKAVVSTKPAMTFPLKKARGRILIPTTKGPKVFQDKGVGTDSDDQAQYEYVGYLPQFGYHEIIGHFWERTNWLLLGPVGPPLELYDTPRYSPGLKHFVVISAGTYPCSYLRRDFHAARAGRVHQNAADAGGILHRDEFMHQYPQWQAHPLPAAFTVAETGSLTPFIEAPEMDMADLNGLMELVRVRL